MEVNFASYFCLQLAVATGRNFHFCVVIILKKMTKMRHHLCIRMRCSDAVVAICDCVGALGGSKRYDERCMISVCLPPFVVVSIVAGTANSPERLLTLGDKIIIEHWISSTTTGSNRTNMKTIYL